MTSTGTLTQMTEQLIKNRQATMQCQQDASKFIEPKADEPKHKKVEVKEFYC